MRRTDERPHRERSAPGIGEGSAHPEAEDEVASHRESDDDPLKSHFGGRQFQKPTKREHASSDARSQDAEQGDMSDARHLLSPTFATTTPARA